MNRLEQTKEKNVMQSSGILSFGSGIGGPSKLAPTRRTIVSSLCMNASIPLELVVAPREEGVASPAAGMEGDGDGDDMIGSNGYE
jgi:hypothetical protein